MTASPEVAVETKRETAFAEAPSSREPARCALKMVAVAPGVAETMVVAVVVVSPLRLPPAKAVVFVCSVPVALIAWGRSSLPGCQRLPLHSRSPANTSRRIRIASFVLPPGS